jgi:hypothetical protein
MRPTIVSHGIEIQPHEIGEQECVSLRIPRAIPYVQGIRGVLTAPGWSELRRRHGLVVGLAPLGRGGEVEEEMLRSLACAIPPCDSSSQER